MQKNETRCYIVSLDIYEIDMKILVQSVMSLIKYCERV